MSPPAQHFQTKDGLIRQCFRKRSVHRDPVKCIHFVWDYISETN